TRTTRTSARRWRRSLGAATAYASWAATPGLRERSYRQTTWVDWHDSRLGARTSGTRRGACCSSLALARVAEPRLGASASPVVATCCERRRRLTGQGADALGERTHGITKPTSSLTVGCGCRQGRNERVPS